MTTATPTRAAGASRTNRPGADLRPVSFATLTLVEWRKQLDTRAGRWMLAVIAIITSAVLAVMMAVNCGNHSFSAFVVSGGDSRHTQPRRQPHQHNAQVGGHGQQHFALHFFLVAAGCGGIGRLARQLTEPQQRTRTLYQPNNLVAERFHQWVRFARTTSPRIYFRQHHQQRARPRRRVSPQVGEDVDDAGTMLLHGLSGTVVQFAGGIAHPHYRTPHEVTTRVVQVATGTTKPCFVLESKTHRERVGRRHNQVETAKPQPVYKGCVLKGYILAPLR